LILLNLKVAGGQDESGLLSSTEILEPGLEVDKSFGISKN
jgi:hypothetical protein